MRRFAGNDRPRAMSILNIHNLFSKCHSLLKRIKSPLRTYLILEPIQGKEKMNLNHLEVPGGEEKTPPLTHLLGRELTIKNSKRPKMGQSVQKYKQLQ